jgi:hypothetical protein
VSTSSPFVVVSGLAASGKTAVAEPLAAEVGIPLVPKDVIKEALFDAVGFGGWEWSKTLSRAADAAMVRVSQDLGAAEWQRASFFDRSQKLPLGVLGPVVEVDTERPVDITSVAARVLEASLRLRG